MQIILTYEESSRKLQLQAPLGTSPLMVIALLSQGITALAAPMVGGGKDLIVPAQGMSGLKTS